MARNTKVRSDENGVFVRTGGHLFRPGSVSGLVRVDMSDGGLRAGDEVRAGHVGGTTRCKVTTPTGADLHWHTDYQHAREAERAAELAAMQAAGIDPHAAIRAILRPATVRRHDEPPVDEAAESSPGPRR